MVDGVAVVMAADGQADFFRQPPVLRHQATDQAVVGRQRLAFDVGEGAFSLVVGATEGTHVIGKAAQQNDDAAVPEQAVGVGIVSTQP